MIMVLLVEHSEAICPLPKHLKHFMFLVPVLDEEVEVLCLLPPTLDAADFPCGDVAAGRNELPPTKFEMSLTCDPKQCLILSSSSFSFVGSNV